MWRLSDLVGDLEDPDVITIPGLKKELPIKSPDRLNWNLQENPSRLSRMFKFSREENFNAFIIDVLEHQAETQHHGRMTAQYPQVKIEVWTHTLNDVTEIDYEWAITVNEIYEGYNG